MFPGQGSQFVGMGKDLVEAFPLAKEIMQEVDDAVHCNLSRLAFFGDMEELTLTFNAQPAIMAVSIATFTILSKQAGFTSIADIASLTAGHSLGEYSALCATGVLNLQQAAHLLRTRGQAMQEAVPKGMGLMLALINTDLDNAQKIAASASEFGICEIANDNGAGQFVLSGESEAISKAEQIAPEFGVKRAIKLNVSAPFHSSLMLPAANIMEKSLGEQALTPYLIPVVANYTAQIGNDTAQTRELLVKQICGRVRWRETIELMVANGIKTFIEVGPGKVLSTLAKRISPEAEVFNIHTPAELDAYCDLTSKQG